MYKLDNFSCICITILFIYLDVMLVVAYRKQRKINEEIDRAERIERESTNERELAF